MMLLQAAYLYELDKRGHNTVVTETMRLPDGSGLNHQVIAYDYDPLYRITEAAYTGVLSGTYAYEYNAVGSRVYYSTNITHTETTTYNYNAANQLQESKDLLTAELTTYDWDDVGRLITTTVASVVDKVYQYSQDGDLTQAEVDGLVTTFAYDGNGFRLQMSVAGEATTYLPDYSGRSNRILFEQDAEETKQYLYGVACLGEFFTNNTTSATEWRYYQRDGNNLVRQTTDEIATITLAWTFSPEGVVLLGEEGLVTHLVCEDEAVYDWSTGLIFKGGGYFDPRNGIWITMGGAIIWQKSFSSSSRKKNQNKRKRYALLIFLSLLMIFIVVGNVGGKALGTGENICMPVDPPVYPQPLLPPPIDERPAQHIFSKIPIISTDPWIAAYGNTIVAYNKAYVNPYREYSFSLGLHGGLDLGGSKLNKDKIIAGTTGTVFQIDGVNDETNEVTNEYDAAVYIRKGLNTIKYQHFEEIFVKVGDEIDYVDKVLGTVGWAPAHLHLEVRDDTYLHNPLLYFDKPHYNEIYERIDGIGNVDGETFYLDDDKNIPWLSATQQPRIRMAAGFWMLEKYFGVKYGDPLKESNIVYPHIPGNFGG